MVDSHQVIIDLLEKGDLAADSTELHQHVLENEERYSAACPGG